MPLPTIDNRASFKNYVRHFKNKFTSAIQDVSLSQIEGVLTSKSSGIGDVPVKFIIFDNYDTVDVSSIRDSSEYIYLPGLPNDKITLRLDNNDYEFTFVGEDSGISYGGTTYTLDQEINVSGSLLTVKGLGGTLLQLQPGPTYNITESSTSLNEGESLTITVNTANTTDSTLYWTINQISGTVNSSDLSNLSGSFATTNNVGSFNIDILADFLTEGLEKFEVQIRTDSISGSVVVKSSEITINDTSQTATYSISENSTSVNEGESVIFTVTTTNVPDGSTLYYSTTGTIDSSDFTDGLTSGSFVITSGTATITKQITEDLSLNNTEGTETFSIQIRTNSVSGTIVATSQQITIADTSSATYSTSISSTQSAEETTLTVTVNTTGVPDGYTLYYTTTGVAATTTDITLTNGSFVVNSNVGTFNINLNQDYIPDDGETFDIQIRTGSITGSIVDTIGPITVDDTPFVLTATSNLTIIDESILNNLKSLTINVSTVNVPDGTTFDAEVRSISGTVDSSDLSLLTTSFSISNDAASFNINITRDGATEGLETFVVDIKKSGVLITSTPVITITDTSFVGSRKTNKTFGPILVNRDNGVDADASDWYTICGLDKLNAGSKISLFVDISGSMDKDTVRASLNKLITQLQSKNIILDIIEGSGEDWITPHDRNL